MDIRVHPLNTVDRLGVWSYNKHMTKKLERKTVEIDRKRIPLRSLIHGKEIREAAQALETFRLKMNDKEILYGAKLYIDWIDYGTCEIVARRPETDNEYAERLERLRISEELKRQRELNKKKLAEQRAREEEFRKRANAVETIRRMAKENGLTQEQLVDLLTNA